MGIKELLGLGENKELTAEELVEQIKEEDYARIQDQLPKGVELVK